MSYCIRQAVYLQNFCKWWELTTYFWSLPSAIAEDKVFEKSKSELSWMSNICNKVTTDLPIYCHLTICLPDRVLRLLFLKGKPVPCHTQWWSTPSDIWLMYVCWHQPKKEKKLIKFIFVYKYFPHYQVQMGITRTKFGES